MTGPGSVASVGPAPSRMPSNPAESVRQPLTTRNIAKPSRNIGGVGQDHRRHHDDPSISKSPQKKPQHHHTLRHPRPSLIPRPKTAQEVASAPRAMIGRLQTALPRPAKLLEADLANTTTAANVHSVEPPPRDQITTPKKRAVPLEDVHVRNAPGGSPSKRSRSSKDGTGSSVHEPSTGTTLAQDLSVVKVAETTTTTSTTASRPIRPIRPPSATKATTIRIDRQPRVTDQERATRDRQAYEDRKVWRHKFKKAFPSFVFYFDAFDEATGKDLTSVIQSLGGSVDQFFSRNVTHLITTRLVPSVNIERHDGGKENSPTKDGAGAKDGSVRHKPLRPTVSKSRFSPTKGGTTAAAADPRPRNSQPLYSERNPFDDAGPPASGSNDILLKAQGFGMKVWRHDKLTTILRMLIDDPPLPPLPTDKQDLSQMLEREKLYGTHERDPNASRNDHHYFRKGNFYLLVEDATMEHRPIMCSEFEYGRHQQQEGIEPPWPVLYGELEGRCPFTKYEVTDQQRSKMSRGRNTHQTLRRAVSMGNMLRRHTGPLSPRPPNEAFLLETPRNGINHNHHHHHHHNTQYPLASGNSVSITSNIASTTSTALTDQVGTIAGLPQNRRVAELNRRMHTPLMHSPTSRLPASPVSFVAGSVGSGLGIAAADVGSGSGSSMVTPGGGGGNPTAAATATPSHSRGAVVRRMLGMTEHEAKRPSVLAQSGMRRSVSTGAVIPVRPQEKRPGYCENCRIKYDNFDDHVVSRKHRKFAVDDTNFVDIDQLILRVQRPPGPEYPVYAVEDDDDDGSGAETRLDERGLLDGSQGPCEDGGQRSAHWDDYRASAETRMQTADGGHSGVDEAVATDTGDGRDFEDGMDDERDSYDEDDEGEGKDDADEEEGEGGEEDEHEYDDEGEYDEEVIGVGKGVDHVYDEDAEWHRQATVHRVTSGHVAPSASYLQGGLAHMPDAQMHALSRRAGTPYGQADVDESGSSYV